MRIAFVSLMGGLPWGGSEALWHAVATHALQQGDEVFVSVYDWGRPHEKIKQLQKQGALIHYRKRFNPAAGSFEKIKRFIKKRKPSIDKDYQSIIDFKPLTVFISQGDSFDLSIHHRPFYELLVKNKIAYSMVCHSHTQYGFIPPKEIYPAAVEILKNALRVFFVSKRQWLLTERRLVAKLSNASLTWNPLNMQLPVEPLQGPLGSSFQMAIVGPLSGTKGQDTAMEVLGTAAWKERDWVLNLYGDGDGKDYLKALAHFYGIDKYIKFHGHVNDIIKIWKTNHIMLIPSAGEGLPISLVEAMACGRPAVVTDVGGNTELIIENETGFVAPSPTTGAFSLALENAWQQKDNLQQLGQNAFDKINMVLEKKPGEKIYELLKHAG